MRCLFFEQLGDSAGKRNQSAKESVVSEESAGLAFVILTALLTLVGGCAGSRRRCAHRFAAVIAHLVAVLVDMTGCSHNQIVLNHFTTVIADFTIRTSFRASGHCGDFLMSLMAARRRVRIIVTSADGAGRSLDAALCAGGLSDHFRCIRVII